MAVTVANMEALDRQIANADPADVELMAAKKKCVHELLSTPT